MKQIAIYLLLTLGLGISLSGQEKEKRDSFPQPIPDYLSPQLFVPAKYLNGFLTWNYAPLMRPVVEVLPV